MSDLFGNHIVGFPTRWLICKYMYKQTNLGNVNESCRYRIRQFDHSGAVMAIMKTCQCNVYPLEPHFYIAKLGYAGVYLFFLFLLQNIDCGYSLEPPRRGGSNMYPKSMF